MELKLDENSLVTNDVNTVNNADVKNESSVHTFWVAFSGKGQRI